MDDLDTCAVCRKRIDGSEACIWDGGQVGPTYQPFLEDFRTTPAHVYHLKCWANEHGLDSLLAIAHENDRRNRDQFWSLIKQVEDLQERGST